MNFIHVCSVVGCTLCAVWEQCEFTRRNLVHKTTYFHSWARANFLTLGQTLQRIKASVAQQNTKPNTKKNTKQNTKQNTNQNTKQNTKQKTEQNTKPNTKQITKQNTKKYETKYEKCVCVPLGVNMEFGHNI